MNFKDEKEKIEKRIKYLVDEFFKYNEILYPKSNYDSFVTSLAERFINLDRNRLDDVSFFSIWALANLGCSRLTELEKQTGELKEENKKEIDSLKGRMAIYESEMKLCPTIELVSYAKENESL